MKQWHLKKEYVYYIRNKKWEIIEKFVQAVNIDVIKRVNFCISEISISLNIMYVGNFALREICNPANANLMELYQMIYAKLISQTFNK